MCGRTTGEGIASAWRKSGDEDVGATYMGWRPHRRRCQLHELHDESMDAEGCCVKPFFPQFLTMDPSTMVNM